jgi:hypothetical protein
MAVAGRHRRFPHGGALAQWHAALMISTSFRVGKRYRCEMRFTNRGLVAEWTPAPPKKLTPEELAEYRRGRDTFLAEVAKLIGGDILVVG